MFANECLGELAYESTTAAIFLAGLFLSFLVDYLGSRFVLWRQGQKPHGHSHSHDEEHSTPVPAESKEDARTPNGSAVFSHSDDDHSSHVNIHAAAEEKVGVWVLEAGIIFHSLR
jgi:zinc transporter 1/2/3